MHVVSEIYGVLKRSATTIKCVEMKSIFSQS